MWPGYEASCHAIMVEDRRLARLSDLPVLVTCQSGTLAILSSEVNSPVTHESTW